MSEHLCGNCSAALPARELECSRCQTRVVDEPTQRVAREETRKLLGEMSRSPYFKDHKQLGYTLRSQVRGFLDDERSTLALSLRSWLATQEARGGPHLVAWLLAEEIDDALPQLANALRHLQGR